MMREKLCSALGTSPRANARQHCRVPQAAQHPQEVRFIPPNYIKVA